MPIDNRAKNLEPKKRMQYALELVFGEPPVSQAEAARRAGITRPALNRRVQERKKVMAEQQERSKAARMARAGTDPLGINEIRRVRPPVEFNQYYFGHVPCPDCGDVVHEIPGFHEEMLGKMGDPNCKRLLVNVGPFHAKSTVGTLRESLWEIHNDPNIRIGLVSKGQRLANVFAAQIMQWLQDEDLYLPDRNLIQDWGPFLGEGSRGGVTEFWVSGRQTGEKDPTVSTYGIGTAIYGRRFDVVKLDDVFDMENSRNPDTVAHNVDWITGEIESRVGKSGRIHIFGTRVGPQDGYSHLQKLPGYEVIRYPVILDEPAGITLWPEHFDIDAAKLKRGTMSSEKWQLLYQNAETLGANASFTPEMIDLCKNPGRHLGQYDPSWQLVIGLDPAGANKQSGYTALVLLGVDTQTGKRYLVDIVNALQLKAPQLRQQLFLWADQYYGSLKELRVESNGLQSQLVQYNDEIRQYMTAKGVRVVPHITHKNNKWDQNFGVEAMAPMFYNQMIDLPWADINTRKKVGELAEQLIQFPIGLVTDLYMAMWFAELGCKDIQQRTLLPGFNTREKVPNRIRARRGVIDFASRSVRQATRAEQEGFGGRFHPEYYEQPVRLANMDRTLQEHLNQTG